MERKTLMRWADFEEIKVSYQSKIKAADRPHVRGSEDLVNLLRSVWDEDNIELSEQFKIVLLNTSNRVMGIKTISTGSLTGTVLDIRMIFTIALKVPCIRIALAHNHPSGSTKPSPEDIKLTMQLVEAARLFNMSILDHVILTSDTYFSFSDEGLL